MMMRNPRLIKHGLVQLTLIALMLLGATVEPVLASGMAGTTVGASVGTVTAAPDYSDVLQRAIDAARVGGTVVVPRRTSHYEIRRTIQVWKPLTISLSGAVIQQANAGQDAFNVTAGGVHFIGGTISGSSSGTYRPGETGIEFLGADAAKPISNVSVTGTFLRNWGSHAILANFVDGLRVTKCLIRGVGYAGIGGTSVVHAVITGNDIADIAPGADGNAYGIYASRASEASLKAYPRSAHWMIRHNRIHGPSFWEAIDTHGGRAIVISKNLILGALYGIAAGPSVAGSRQLAAPLRIRILGNRVYARHLAPATGMGISLAGIGRPLNLIMPATGTIAGNTVRGYSPVTSWQSYGAIHVKLTVDVRIALNTVINPGVHGIFLNYENRRTLVVGNTVIGPHTDQALPSGDGSGLAIGIHVQGPFNVGCIEANTIRRGLISDRYVLTHAVFVEGNIGNHVALRRNVSGAPVVNLARGPGLCAQLRSHM
jgi:hypothetical protein